MMLKIGVTWIYSTHCQQDGVGSTTMKTCCEECIAHQRALSPWTDGMESLRERGPARTVHALPRTKVG